MDTDEDNRPYKILTVKDNQSKTLGEQITIYARTSYQNIVHVNKANTDSSPNSSRRDLFSANIDNTHSNEELRGKKVFLKKIGITTENELQCWREMMIGIEMRKIAELNGDLIGHIVDNWIEVINDSATNVYYATLDRGTSIKQALKTKGQLKREKKALIHFNQFLKIAHDLATTLIILKKNNILHRDINVSNVLIHEFNNMSGIRTELIDFGWAKKIVDHTKTAGVGTAGKNAPEITFRNTTYKSKICAKPYSFPVDVYALGQTLVETLEMDRGFLKVFAKQAGFKKTGNPTIDESIGSTLFHFLAEKNDTNASSYAPMSDLSDEKKYNMIQVHNACQMPLQNENFNELKRKLESFLEKNSHGTRKETDSISQRFLRNFWFRHLDKDKGWSDARIDLVIDLVMRMLNYWPDERITCEQIYDHDIFKEIDEHTGQLIITPRTDVDADSIDNLVVYAKDENFQKFRDLLAKQKSKLFIKTKYEQDFFTRQDNLSQRISIHTIEAIEEKVKFGNEYSYTHGEIITKVTEKAVRGDKGMTDEISADFSFLCDEDFIDQLIQNSNNSYEDPAGKIPQVVSNYRDDGMTAEQQAASNSGSASSSISRWGSPSRPIQQSNLDYYNEMYNVSQWLNYVNC